MKDEGTNGRVEVVDAGETLDDEETLSDFRPIGYWNVSEDFFRGREVRDTSELKRVILLYLTQLMSGEHDDTALWLTYSWRISPFDQGSRSSQSSSRLSHAQRRRAVVFHPK